MCTHNQLHTLIHILPEASIAICRMFIHLERRFGQHEQATQGKSLNGVAAIVVGESFQQVVGMG